MRLKTRMITILISLLLPVLSHGETGNDNWPRRSLESVRQILHVQLNQPFVFLLLQQAPHIDVLELIDALNGQESAYMGARLRRSRQPRLLEMLGTYNLRALSGPLGRLEGPFEEADRLRPEDHNEYIRLTGISRRLIESLEELALIHRASQQSQGEAREQLRFRAQRVRNTLRNHWIEARNATGEFNAMIETADLRQFLSGSDATRYQRRYDQLITPLQFTASHDENATFTRYLFAALPGFLSIAPHHFVAGFTGPYGSHALEIGQTYDIHVLNAEPYLRLQGRDSLRGEIVGYTYFSRDQTQISRVLTRQAGSWHPLRAYWVRRSTGTMVAIQESLIDFHNTTKVGAMSACEASVTPREQRNSQ